MSKLAFSEEGKFKILQFTDIHFSDNNQVDEETVRLMRKILKEENPDFIMITGDTVYGETEKISERPESKSITG